ncbi:MAG: ABC transporter permease, partial [Tumebacillaceae bacterium]
MMRDVDSVFHHRRKNSWRTALLIMRKIMHNGGVFVGALILMVLAVLGYQKLVAWMPADFPSALAMAAIVSLGLTKGGVRTFLKEPDLVFLLPAESRMNRYFRQAMLYSMFYQCVQMLYLVGVFYPLFLQFIGTPRLFWVIMLTALMLKAWNVAAQWHELLYGRARWVFILLRYGLNVLLLQFVMIDGYFDFFRLSGVLIIWIWLLRYKITPHQYPWMKLVAIEQRTVATYYAWANFFIDIPQVKDQVRPRKWLSEQIAKLPGDKRYPYLYLFTRTFIRHSEYFGIFIRLTIFIGIALFFITNYWLALVVYLVGLYMMGIQLPNISAERRYPDLIRIYPLTEEDKVHSFSLLALRLLRLQSLLLTLPLLLGPLPWITALVILAI